MNVPSMPSETSVQYQQPVQNMQFRTSSRLSSALKKQSIIPDNHSDTRKCLYVWRKLVIWKRNTDSWMQRWKRKQVESTYCTTYLKDRKEDGKGVKVWGHRQKAPDFCSSITHWPRIKALPSDWTEVGVYILNKTFCCNKNTVGSQQEQQQLINHIFFLYNCSYARSTYE